MNPNRLTQIQAAAREAAHAYNDDNWALVERIMVAVYDTLTDEEKTVYAMAYVQARGEG